MLGENTRILTAEYDGSWLERPHFQLIVVVSHAPGDTRDEIAITDSSYRLGCPDTKYGQRLFAS